MSLWIKDESHVPSNGWFYPHVDNVHFIRTFNYSTLYPTIVKTYRANNVEPPTQQEVIDYMCANLHIPCYEGKDPLINKFTLGLPQPLPTHCCGGPVVPFPKGVVP